MRIHLFEHFGISSQFLHPQGVQPYNNSHLKLNEKMYFIKYGYRITRQAQLESFLIYAILKQVKSLLSCLVGME